MNEFSIFIGDLHRANAKHQAKPASRAAEAYYA